MFSPTPLASPDSGTKRFQGLQFGVVTLGLLVIFAVTGSSAYDAWRSYRYTLAENGREITNVANALAEQTRWNLQAVDLLLTDTVHWYRNESRGLRRDELDAALAARTAAVKQVRQVTIMDAEGNQLHRSRGPIAQNYNAADRSYFIAQKTDPGRGLFMSEPLTTRTEGRIAIILSRRIDDDQGHFAGVVIANVDLEELYQFYRAVDMGAGSTIQLLRDDGTLLVRNPRVPDTVGRKFPALTALGSGPGARLVRPATGDAYLIAASPVSNAPLQLVVTRDLAVALQAWRSETIRVAIRTFMVILLGVLTLALLSRQIRRKEQLESQLRQSQKMEAIGTLAGGIAHDFNNVLGAILGYGELAVQRSPPDGDVRRYLDNIMHAAERAKMLVERILGFSRSGLGDLVPVAVQSIVQETLEMLEASLPIGIRLERKLEAGDAAVIGDPTYLHQVTMNLCTNAVQAMEHGGRLEVILRRVSMPEPRTMSRGSLDRGDYVLLSVSDTGCGIPPTVVERIFDPFFTTKNVGEGTGLGLSLVHGIVADLGGAIDVASTIDQGTRFDIWLPATDEAPIHALPTADSLPRGSGETIMIVDDEQALVELTEEIVAQLGYEPVGFTSSTMALDAFRASPQRFAAVLTDEAMPDLLGTDFARQIRAMDRNVPIIMMSGHAVTQLAKRAAEFGVNELLHKPLHGRDIAEVLARVLGTAS